MPTTSPLGQKMRGNAAWLLLFLPEACVSLVPLGSSLPTGDKWCLQAEASSLTRRRCLQRTLPFVAAAGLVSEKAFASEAPPPGPAQPRLAPEYFDESLIRTAPDAGRSFFPTLTPPFRNRATFRYSVGRDTWAFEQLITFVNVTATIKCHVVQLQSSGGLWVHSPQWPTNEFCQLLNELGRPVEHVVLPCNALEHKAPMKAFVKRYPDASVWISPGQYGPFGSCGQTLTDMTVSMGYRVDGILGDATNTEPPWADEFDIATFYVDIPKNAGPVSEVAFCHRPTKTLIARDAVVFIPSQADVRLDLFETYFGRDKVQEDPSFWPRTVLQAVFLPLNADDAGAYPGFQALANRLVRAPILRGVVDSRAPAEVREWTAQVAQWDFDRILTSHFASPIVATPKNFDNAFAYLDDTSRSDLTNLPPIRCKDWGLLQYLNSVIAENNLGAATGLIIDAVAYDAIEELMSVKVTALAEKAW